jgi:ferredoxin-NADP reductase
MLATDRAVRRLTWQVAEVTDVVDETPRTRSLILKLPDWSGHRPGQHVDIRLTGEDGYRAQRSYSIASAPEAAHVAITVERIDDGEVSPYLAGVVEPGDRFELRGPIGGYFVWTAAAGGPLFLVAGGSGVVPLMAMLRHRAAADNTIQAFLIYSSRSIDDIIYREEIERMSAGDDRLTVFHTLTRQRPEGWTGGSRRIDREMLETLGISPTMTPHIFICGPTPMVEAAAAALADIGHTQQRIRTERFGPTGA